MQVAVDPWYVPREEREVVLPGLRFQLLGPLTVTRDGESVTVRPRERRLLCALLVNPGQTLSVDQLAEALWGDSPPANPTAALHTSVHRLRKALSGSTGQSPVLTQPPGYALDVDLARIDVSEFAQLVDEAAEAEIGTAAVLLKEALSLWRGPPFQEVAYEEFAQPVIRELDQLRLTALERRVAAELELGAGPSLVGELEGLVSEYPHHEQLWGHLMVALYRAGRQAEALTTFQRARSTLVDEYGLDPSPALRRLEEAVLMQDPNLGSSGQVQSAPGPKVSMLPRANVPVPLTRLIGRSQELQQTVNGLRKARLVTIVGPPGVGKTRLALAAAEAVDADFADGIDYAAFDRYELEGTPQQRYLRDLGLHVDQAKATDRIISLVRDREMLQILDGCETILDDLVPAIPKALAACPGLTLLITSRQRSGVPGEVLIPLEPLDCEGPAIELFAERARALRPDFEVTTGAGPLVDRIVRAADGLPLGLELAAGRVIAFPLETIAAELEERIDLLSTRDPTAPSEHRSLEAAIDISWSRLSPTLQETLMLLATFRAPWDLEAAASLCGISEPEMADRCVELTEQSLIVSFARSGAGADFALLNSVQTFALRRLSESDVEVKAFDRHGRYHLRFVEQAHEQLSGPDQGLWLRRIEHRIPDLRAVFARLRTRDPAAALDFVISLVPFFERSDTHRAGVELLVEAIGSNPEPTEQKAEALAAAGYLATPRMSEYVDNIRFSHPLRGLREATSSSPAHLKAARAALDMTAEGIELYDQLGLRERASIARISLASQLAAIGDLETAREQFTLFEEERRDEPSSAVAYKAQVFLANLALAEGDYERARERAERALEIADAANDAWRTIESLDVLVRVAQAQGNWADAYGRYREALTEHAGRHGLPGAALLEAQQALQATTLLDPVGASRHAGRALRLARRHGLKSLEGWVRYTQAMGGLIGGEHESAILYVDQGYEIFESLGDVDRQAAGHMLVGMIEGSRGDCEAASAANRRSLQHGRGASRPLTISFGLLGMARDHHRRGDDETAAVILGAAEATRDRIRFTMPSYVPNSDLAATLRARLGDSAWDAARRRGAGLTLDEAVDLALS